MTDAPAITETAPTNELVEPVDPTDGTKLDYAVLTWLVGATFVVILNETIMASPYA